MAEPEISISTSFDYSIPLDVQIPLISEAGFTHVSLGQDENHSGILDPERLRGLKTLIEDYDLAIDTIHGPVLSREENIRKLKETIAAAEYLEVPVVVVHPGPFEIEGSEGDELFPVIINTLEDIVPVARKAGIRLAVENVVPGTATELTIRAVQRSDPETVGFCYDSSHEQIDGPRPHDLLELLKDRLIAVHLSDRVKEFVDHVPPGEGFIDWPKLAALLKETSFTGPLLFEVMVEHTSVKETEPFLKLVYERACYVHSLMEGN